MRAANAAPWPSGLTCVAPNGLRPWAATRGHLRRIAAVPQRFNAGRARREENREERGKKKRGKAGQIAHMLPLPFLLHCTRSASVVLFSSIAPGRSVASPRANAARNDREQAWSRWLRVVMVAGKP